MKYKIKKETKPTLPTFGKYKAVAVHDKTVTSKQIFKETAARSQLQEININAVMLSVIDVINQHLRDGDRVYLNGWGTMKLEIESEKVENPKDFRAPKHIRAVRLHFIPASTEGTQELYDGITFEKDRD
jgi:nucleoid DNA-binding protein